MPHARDPAWSQMHCSALGQQHAKRQPTYLWNGELPQPRSWCSKCRIKLYTWHTKSEAEPMPHARDPLHCYSALEGRGGSRRAKRQLKYLLNGTSVQLDFSVCQYRI